MKTKIHNQKLKGQSALCSSAVLGANPPDDGQEWECQCARCGSSIGWEECESCGGEGVSGHDCGEDCCCCMYPEENMLCGICDGEGSFGICLSSPEWCEANPLPGRDATKRGELEWFVIAPNDPKLSHADRQPASD